MIQERTGAIVTERLELAVMGPAVMRRLLTGDWPGAGQELGAPIPTEWTAMDWSWMSLYVERATRDPGLVPWLARAALLREDGQTLVGNMGFHGRPEGRPLAVEIGYSVVSDYRRRGFAAEAVRGLMKWGTAESGVRRFHLSISPENDASLGVARTLGFRQVGAHHHPQRGVELIFQLDV